MQTSAFILFSTTKCSHQNTNLPSYGRDSLQKTDYKFELVAINFIYCVNLFSDFVP